jgi:4-hydroxybenzoate polyprenyltransferase
MRYRVAVMLALFAILAIALHDGFSVLHWQYLLALFALVCTYVSATGFNDLADEAIDKINHAGKQGRLLVTGEATRRELATVAIGASFIMLLCGLVISPAALGVMLLSLAINIAYSLPPFRLSYRTFLAPFALAIGYVIAPYLLGLSLLGVRITYHDGFLLAALYMLFLARINLKDFRDRKGDSKYGKPTLLLHFGKTLTILASQIALWSGVGLAVMATASYLPIALASVLYGGLISWLLWRLQQTPEGPAELVIIGVAAKVGNGLLLSLLAMFMLSSQSAPIGITILVISMLFIGSAANFKFLNQDPKLVLESYRG